MLTRTFPNPIFPLLIFSSNEAKIIVLFQCGFIWVPIWVCLQTLELTFNLDKLYEMTRKKVLTSYIEPSNKPYKTVVPADPHRSPIRHFHGAWRASTQFVFPGLNPFHSLYYWRMSKKMSAISKKISDYCLIEFMKLSCNVEFEGQVKWIRKEVS